MTKQKLVQFLSQNLDGYSITNGIDVQDPFGWDISLEGNGFPQKKAKPKKIRKPKPYDAGTDIRLGNDLKPSRGKPEECGDITRHMALCIVSGLCDCTMLLPSDADLLGLLDIAGLSPEDMDSYIRTELQDDMTCFGIPEIKPLAALLHRVLWEALKEGCGLQKGNMARKRLAAFFSYMQEHGLVQLICLQPGIFHKADGPMQDAGQEDCMSRAVMAYEAFFFFHALEQCKADICLYEGDKVLQDVNTEIYRVKVEVGQMLARALREKRKKSGRRQDKPNMEALTVPEMLGKGQKLGARLALDGCADDISSSMKRASVMQCWESGDFSQILELICDDLERGPGQAKIRAFKQRVRENFAALDRYSEAVKKNATKMISETAEEKRTRMQKLSGAVLAECAFLAILRGDETYTLNIASAVFEDLGQLLGISGLFRHAPELSDEKDWDDTVLPRDNGDLALEVTSGKDVSLYEYGVEGIKPGILHQLRLNEAISEYAGCRFNASLCIRKSIIDAFKEAGYPEGRARDFAIIVATLQYAMQAGISKGMGWPLSAAQANDASGQEAAAAQETALKGALGEAGRQRKAAEQESQRLRHEVSSLQKEKEGLEQQLASLKAELEKRDALIGLYEKNMENDREDGEAEESLFPYDTGMNAVLYGGFHSFHQEVLKLIPGLRIVEVSSHLDTSVFRNADIVFIQINKTNHGNYWNVIDTAKNAGVPFHHLNYASPRRCAMEMVMKLKEMEAAPKTE